jgi:cytochrome b561
LGHQLEELHSALAVALMALVAIHVAAAIYHYRVIKDDILQRMLPAKASH